VWNIVLAFVGLWKDGFWRLHKAANLVLLLSRITSTNNFKAPWEWRYRGQPKRSGEVSETVLGYRDHCPTPGSGVKMKITNEVNGSSRSRWGWTMKQQWPKLHILLVRLGYSLSLCTVLLCRTTLGWTFHGSAYCQLIREQNKHKRLKWALKFKDDNFSDVVFTDESSIQQETIGDFAVRSRANHLKASWGKLSTLVPVMKL